MPAIVADAARESLTRDPEACAGRFFVDEDVLGQQAGVTEFARYRADSSGKELMGDCAFNPATQPT